MAASLLPGRTKKESLMHTPFGHLTYCTNIHPGESWQDHFDAIQQHVPVVKKSFHLISLLALACAYRISQVYN